MPTQPKIDRYLGDGVFTIEGIRLNMGGLWRFSLRLLAENQWHRTDFDVYVALGDGAPASEEWSPTELVKIQSLSLEQLFAKPNDPSNRFAKNVDAAAFGKALFFEKGLSKNGKISCASCHQPERSFTDGKRVGQGLSKLGRNTPSIIGAAYQTWFYWDGRRDSLWSQSIVPIEASLEMGKSRLEVLRWLKEQPEYAKQYESIFGALPDLSDIAEKVATPLGDATAKLSWKNIPMRKKRAINSAFSNIGKSIAAYEMSVLHQPSQFDRYAQGLLSTGKTPLPGSELNDTEKRGLRLFIDDQNRCLNCHNGPRFTNDGFHNVGTGTASGVGNDSGRLLGKQMVLLDEFNCAGRYSDANQSCTELQYLEKNPAHITSEEGAFKVPSLRNVADTGPYMHDGRFKTLHDVLVHYRDATDGGAAQTELLPLPELTDDDLKALEAFLKTLSASTTTN
ncbi:MAG: cytochrome c peroxidase [Polyangiales bacterium]